MKNLTLILGPKTREGQKYLVYRFNGETFDSFKSGDNSILFSLGTNGTTTKWFTPSSMLSTVFRHNQKELIQL
jgi:hypothetical protein